MPDSRPTSRPGRTLTCKEALQLLLDQVDFTAGACSLTDMVGQCVPKGVFEQCRAAIAAASEKQALQHPQSHDEAKKRIEECVREIEMIADTFGYDQSEWLAGEDFGAT